MDPNGYTNRDLRALVVQLLGKVLHALSAGQLTYDLRRLRAHGLITRLPGSHRYRVTDTGLHHALFLTRAYHRLLHGGLAELADTGNRRLRAASNAYQRTIDSIARESGLAA